MKLTWLVETGVLTRLLNDSELEHLVLGVSATKSVEEADI